MLKKFNILLEEIKQSLENDFRFIRASKFLFLNLSDEEKSKLNKEYNKIVEEELKEAERSKSPITIYFCKLETNGSHGGILPKCIIDKVFEENGTIYCTLFTNDYEETKKRAEREYSPENVKRIWGNSMTSEKVEQAKEKMLNLCIKTFPIYQITTEKILKMMSEYEKELKNFDKEKYYSIFDDVDENLKYLIEKNYISKDKILSLLSVSNKSMKEIYLNIDIFENYDEKIIKMFKVDLNSKEFKEAEISSNKSAEYWYFSGGTRINFYIKTSVSAGERFDINRFSYIPEYKYTHTTGNNSGW